MEIRREGAFCLPAVFVHLKNPHNLPFSVSPQFLVAGENFILHGHFYLAICPKMY
ncbi:MAG: hypothetical protein GF311_28625 [Candidatus Lokiarchaeota archaeon]|nr:hypothetical protein [Candidatus Lokiarchaeota archaeon]